MKRIFIANKIETSAGELMIKRVFGLENSHCAKYSRILAQELFNIEYPAVDAWNLPLHLESYQFNEKSIGIGDLILFYNPKSRFNKRLDEASKPIIGTHTVLYLGDNKYEEKLFAHQYIDSQEILTLDELIMYKLEPKLILRK